MESEKSVGDKKDGREKNELSRCGETAGCAKLVSQAKQGQCMTRERVERKRVVRCKCCSGAGSGSQKCKIKVIRSDNVRSFCQLFQEQGKRILPSSVSTLETGIDTL
ncbi:hypothetical protein ABVT39_024963 [Epinephelus coioides]